MQVSYCEEHVNCRRVMIMAHFGEMDFAAKHCHKTCDNCLGTSGGMHETRDMTQVSCRTGERREGFERNYTETSKGCSKPSYALFTHISHEPSKTYLASLLQGRKKTRMHYLSWWEVWHYLQAAKDLVRVVQATGQKHAMTHILDVFRGANTRSVRQHHHDGIAEHGIGKDLRCAVDSLSEWNKAALFACSMLCEIIEKSLWMAFWHQKSQWHDCYDYSHCNASNYTVWVHACRHLCSKDDATRLVRKMIVEGILVEETHRQDNQYASLVSKLKVNHALAVRLTSGQVVISLAFPVRAQAGSKRAKKGTKRRVSFPPYSKT